jgi:stearoyl-CoA desaturase (delta-9 desaturase)
MGFNSSPLNTVLLLILNWGFWFAVFYLVGGPGLACALFGGAFVWAVGVRTFNYEGHGKGEDKRTDGIDYNRKDMSINQLWPGIVAGEWHNNHHLYPKSARSGFKPHQVDFAWYYIKFLSMIGAVTYYRDSKKQFYKDHHEPYVNSKRTIVTESSKVSQ